MKKCFYYIINKKIKGPFTYEDFKKINLTSETYIWTEGMREWMQIKDIPEYSNKLNISSVPPPIPNKIDFPNFKLPEISISQENKKSLLKAYRNIVYFSLSLLIIIGWVFNGKGILTYIAAPLFIISYSLYYYFKEKWNQENEPITKSLMEVNTLNTKKEDYLNSSPTSPHSGKSINEIYQAKQDPTLNDKYK